MTALEWFALAVLGAIAVGVVAALIHERKKK